MIAQLLYIIPAALVFKTLVTTEEELIDTSDVAIIVMLSLCWPIIALALVVYSKESVDKFLNS